MDVKEELKDFVERKGIKKWFKRDNLIILVLSGVLLLIIALPTKDNSSSQPDNKTKKQETAASQSSTEQKDGASYETASAAQKAMTGEEYAAFLEGRLEEILKGMAGVGDVRVMITLESSEELVVEKDSSINRSNTAESDSEGGSRNINQADSKEATIYRTEGSDSEPYVVKTLSPRVEGVFVVARGAGTGEVNRNITEAVQALFGVEAHKIKVVKME